MDIITLATSLTKLSYFFTAVSNFFAKNGYITLSEHTSLFFKNNGIIFYERTIKILAVRTIDTYINKIQWTGSEEIKEKQFQPENQKQTLRFVKDTLNYRIYNITLEDTKRFGETAEITIKTSINASSGKFKPVLVREVETREIIKYLTLKIKQEDNTKEFKNIKCFKHEIANIINAGSKNIPHPKNRNSYLKEESNPKPKMVYGISWDKEKDRTTAIPQKDTKKNMICKIIKDLENLHKQLLKI